MITALLQLTSFIYHQANLTLYAVNVTLTMTSTSVTRSSDLLCQVSATSAAARHLMPCCTNRFLQQGIKCLAFLDRHRGSACVLFKLWQAITLMFKGAWACNGCRLITDGPPPCAHDHRGVVLSWFKLLIDLVFEPVHSGWRWLLPLILAIKPVDSIICKKSNSTWYFHCLGEPQQLFFLTIQTFLFANSLLEVDLQLWEVSCFHAGWCIL